MAFSYAGLICQLHPPCPLNRGNLTSSANSVALLHFASREMTAPSSLIPLPSSIFPLRSSIFHLPSSIFHLCVLCASAFCLTPSRTTQFDTHVINNRRGGLKGI